MIDSEEIQFSPFPLSPMIYLYVLFILFSIPTQEGQYINQVDGYSIRFPKGWTVVDHRKQNPAYTGAYSPNTTPTDFAEIKVIVLPNVSPAGLTAVMESDIATARNLSNQVKVELNQSIRIGGIKGQLVQLTFNSPKLGLIRVINYGFAKHNRLYLIHCFGNQSYLQASANEVQKACLTFRIY